MSVDHGRHSPSSPDSSDQASTALRAPRRKHDEEEPRRQDKSYRRYAAGIERALASFDNARLEWPDYISFLGRLLKAIQAHPPAIDSLPHRFTVANRLAQCLKPSLPSGVHQKTIEVYSYVFLLIGKENLAMDLHVYLPGLSPVLTFASLSLRPYFLSLLETHILVLDGNSLRPALKALVLSILPGMEDETSEDFDRTLHIVDSLKDTAGPRSHKKSGIVSASHDEYFWQCFFLASISNPSRRQGSLAFLNRRLPKLISNSSSDSSLNKESEYDLPSEAESAVSPEPGLLIRCLAAGLEDEQMLIQRGYLDLLLTHLPLNSPVLAKRVDFKDLVRLVGAATSVVTRRDMSLNRRLWSWFLGPETNDDAEEDGNVDVEAKLPNRSPQTTAYFVRHGAKPLIANIVENLSQNPSQPALRAKPFRTCLSLMDRWEIGSIVVPQIFLPAMENISRYQITSNESNFQEALRSVHSFFDGVESGTIWGQILQLITISINDGGTQNDLLAQRIQLAVFIIDNFNVQEEEMLFVHLPLVILASLASITFHLSNPARIVSDLSNDLVENALLVIEKLVHLMPERAELNSSFAQQDADIEGTAEERYQAKIVKLVQRFYSDSKGNLSISPPPFSSKKISEILVDESVKLLLLDSSLGRNPFNIRVQAGILSSLMAKLPIPDSVNYSEIILRLHSSLQQARDSSDRSVPFTSLTAIAHLLGTISSFRSEPDSTSVEEISSLISCLSETVWDYLAPSSPKYHLEAVRCLWQLDDLMPNECLVQALIAKCLGSCTNQTARAADGLEPARKFAILWTHTSSQGPHNKRFKNMWSKSFLALDQSVAQENQDYQSRLFRPLFIILDAADEADSELQYFLRGWLEGLTNADKIFEVLLANIASTQPVIHDGIISNARKQIEHEDRCPDCLYYLQRLSSLLSLSSDNMWASLCQFLESKANEEDHESKASTMMQFIAQTCLEVVQKTLRTSEISSRETHQALQRSALSILCKILGCPESASLQRLKLEEPLIEFLRQSLQSPDANPSCQFALLDTLSAALKARIRFAPDDNRPRSHRRHGSIETAKIASKPSTNRDSLDGSTIQEQGNLLPPPSDIVKCLQEGLKSTSSIILLEKWVQFLVQVLPLFSNALFQNLIPLVETLCRRIRKLFEDLQGVFQKDSGNKNASSEPALMSLLNGLEATLTAGHHQMALDEPKRSVPKSPEPQQGFFGNVVSGVFSSDVHKTRNSAANTRLTVILCFQDALRVCLSIWSWGGISQKERQQDPNCLASFAYVSQRLRNRTRRILDRMFVAETLECLETVISIWAKEDDVYDDPRRSSPSISLLHVLEGSSPKHTIPALFNAIYSRTTPASIDSKWMSTLTSDLTDLEVSQFLVEYTQSLDDDAMDEIWTDCMTFLRDVLTNPLPHHHILPNLLLFLVILAEKMDKTNFGEQRKMRKELGDLFLRHLTATFTTKSGGSHQESAHAQSNGERPANGDPFKRRPGNRKPQYLEFIDTLAAVVPRLSTVLSDADRLATAISNISTNVVSPLVHSKTFPANMKSEYLDLWLTLVRVTSASKIWRKDLLEAFMHPKFFSADPSLALSGWGPLFYQWTLIDKDRINDLCGRITAPTSAGLMFGVGASAARLEADKKTQLNLRRLAFLVIVADEDSAVSSLATLEERTSDLLNATSASSPSSATRAEVFMLLRALILQTSVVHLSFLWPLITSELQKAISSSLPRSADFDTYNVPSLLQACKLLDLLITVNPDDFQAQEWLFITDTIDAVYRPSNWEPVALVDDVAEELGSASAIDSLASPTGLYVMSPEEHRRTLSDAAYRAPFLKPRHLDGALANTSKEEFVSQVLRPFFAQLSIHAYEATYSMKEPDLEGCKRSLIEDLFDDGTLVG